jgi:hypothetical protein
MSVLEERGLFWWCDEPIPAGKLAPASSISGLLKIENDGRISLELDGFLPSEHGPFAAIADSGKMLDKSIQGLLKANGNRLLLTEVIANGGEIRSNNISFQRFLAMNCLVGEEVFPADHAPLMFNSLEVGLAGFEGWLRLGSITISRSKEQISAEYKEPTPAVYDVEDGRLAFNFHINGRIPVGKQADHFSIKEAVSIAYSLNKAVKLEELRRRYGLLEDLFILLTDSYYRLDWPFVSLDDGTKLRCYFLRMKSDDLASPPNWHECWTNFPQLRDVFQNIWSNWKRKREEFGPGFYLYLGTRRGIMLYPEHRFVNLIWGIEAFHRTKYSVEVHSAYKAKLRRILDAVKARADNRWLRSKLKYAYEPPLSERIFEAFKGLPIELEEKRLRTFADSCAKARNDISHFGGHREGASYADFVTDLEKKSSALSILYHCLLLNEIGVDEKILKWWLHEGFRSYQNKWYFVQAGLLDKNCLNPKNGGAKSN